MTAYGASLTGLAKAIDDMSLELVSDSLTGLTCRETDSIVRVLALAGHHYAAAMLLTGHSSADDADDRHADIAARYGDLLKEWGPARADDAAIAAAREYVQGLTA